MAALETTASPPKDTVAFVFLIAMIIVAAIMFGAGASGIASGAVEDMLRWGGIRRQRRCAQNSHGKRPTSPISARRSTARAAKPRASARTQDLVGSDAAQSERLARVEDEVAMLKAKFRALLPADPLKAWPIAAPMS
jgi:hypothetical protein